MAVGLLQRRLYDKEYFKQRFEGDPFGAVCGGVRNQLLFKCDLPRANEKHSKPHSNNK